jgi:tetratricopeptide (TPR) repeat protein
MATTLTPNEQAQLLQTIEMFEVITQSQQGDIQSLEILKEAYYKLARQRDVVNTAKRIAQAYVLQGQLSSAILEYESILQRFPDDPDVRAALSEIEDKAKSFSAPPAAAELEPFEKPQAALANGAAAEDQAATAEVDDGKQVFYRLFVEAKLVSSADFDLYWFRPDAREAVTGVVEPFVQVLADKGGPPVAQSMKIICEKSRLAYLPLERYDLDIETARSFPRNVCQRWCVLPFDRLSKSVLVATANPFNKQATRELEAATKLRLLWYLCPPADLIKAVRKVFR